MLWGLQGVWAGVVLGAAGWLWLWRQEARWPLTLLRSTGRREWGAAAGVVGLIIVVSGCYALPGGFDPSFHCLLIKKAALVGRPAADWLPFADVPVNYPQAVHLQVAALSLLTKAEPATCYLAAAAVFAMLHVAAFALAARTLLGTRGAAGVATALYVTCGGSCSVLGYLHWGGIAGMACQTFLLCSVHLYGRSRRRGDAVALGVCFLAIILTHHLGALITMLVWGSWICLRLLRDRRLSAVSVLLAGVGVQVVAGLPYLLQFVGKSAGIRDSSALAYADEPAYGVGAALALVGVPLIVVAAAAAVTVWRDRASAALPTLSFSFCWLGSLLAVFLLLDRGYRYAMIVGAGRDVTAFTPSRVLSHVAYPLALVAAAMLVHLWRRRSQLPRAVSRLLLTLCVGSCVAGLGYHLRRHLDAPDRRPSDFRLCAWAGEVTPEGALLVFPEASPDYALKNWACYYAWRELDWVGLPASEPRRHPEMLAKLAAFNSGAPAAVVEWLAARQRAAYIVVPATSQLRPQLPLAAESAEGRIYQLFVP
jgi:hypothetical protein